MKKNILLSMAMAFSFGECIFGQMGILDESFGEDGIVTTEFHLNVCGANDVVLQSDGKIVAVGVSNFDFVIARFHPDGTLDDSFGEDGSVSIDFNGNDSEAKSVAIQFDGKIVVAGYMISSPLSNPDYDIALARVNPDGALDNSFGSGGTVTTSINTYEYANSVLLQPDGKILIAGYSTAFTLIRYDTDGSLDDNFGVGGIAFANFGMSSEAKDVILLLPDDKIIAVGGSADITVAKFHADGTLDNSFGLDGITTSGVLGQDRASSVVLQPDGKFIVAGAYNGGILGHNIVMIRFNPDGSKDASFGTDGVVNSGDFFGFQIANSVALQPDGKIVVAGEGWSSSSNFGHDLALARFMPSGEADSTFAWDGYAWISIVEAGRRYYGRANSVLIQPDGKIVAVGKFGNLGISNFTLIQTNEFAEFDSTFSENGIAMFCFGKSYESANSLAIQSDGKIVVSGWSNYFPNLFQEGSFSNRMLVRYEQDGVFDSTFVSANDLWLYKQTSTTGVVLQPGDGKVLVVGTTQEINSISGHGGFLNRHNPDGSLDNNFNSGSTVKFAIVDNWYVGGANAVTTQPDGKIVIAGYTDTTGVQGQTMDIFLARVNSDGTTDSTFRADGFSKLGFAGDEFATALAIQTDGKIVVAGTSANNTNSTDGIVARFTESGNLDSTFGTNGILLIDFGGDESANSIAIQPDGKIVVAGSSDGNFLVTRHDANGIYDNTFATNGTVTTDLGKEESASSVIIQPDGKIVLAASTIEMQSSNSDFVVLRYNEDGSLDETFVPGGIAITNIGSVDKANAIALQPDGKIVVAGESDGDFAVARYLSGLETSVSEKPESKPSVLNLSPNPVHDFLNITLPESTTAPLTVQVFDAQGRLLRHQPLAAGQPLDVAAFSPGMYLMKVVAGERIYAGKFIKQ